MSLVYQYFGILFMKCIVCKKDRLSFSTKKDGSINKVCDICINKKLMIYNERILLGMCANCGKIKPQVGKVTCENCLNKSKKRQEKFRKKAKLDNKCLHCGKNDCEIGYAKCHKCRLQTKLPLVVKLFRNAKSRAKKSKIEFSIEIEDIIIPTHCPILGIKLEENVKIAKPNSYSIDRINSEKGYVKGNIQIISHRANAIKNDATVEELEQLVNYLKTLK